MFLQNLKHTFMAPDVKNVFQHRTFMTVYLRSARPILYYRQYSTESLN